MDAIASQSTGREATFDSAGDRKNVGKDYRSASGQKLPTGLIYGLKGTSAKPRTIAHLKRHPMLREKQWVWIRRHAKSGVIGGAISIVFLGVLVAAIRADNWAEWTGLGKGETTSVSTVLRRDADGRPVETETTTTQPGKTLWDWLGLLGVPLTLAILGYILQRQERNRAEMLKMYEYRRDEKLRTYEQERAEALAKEQREIAANEAKEEILQVYFDRLSSLLVDKEIIEIANRQKIWGDKSEQLAASINVI